MRLQQGIAFLSIFEIGYFDLGRGGAEHSERPPFPCRVVIESTRLMGRGMRGGRAGHGEVGDGTTFGSQWHPRNADCRGGVFAVFAKIPPPTRFTIRAYMPSPVAASLTVKADADGVWDGVYSDVARRIAIKITASRSGFARDQILCPLTAQAQRPSGSSLGSALPAATRPPFACAPTPQGAASRTRGRGGCGAANRPTAAGAWHRYDRGSL